MSLDVVVVTYQSAETIGDCLSALPAETDLTVVDNASADGTADAVAARGVEVIRRPTNDGFAASANLGARIGTGEFILFLNPDAVIDGNNLKRLTSVLDDDASLAVVGPQLVGRGGEPQRSAWPFPSPGRTWAEALGWHRLRRGEPNEQFVGGACFLVRRSAFEAVGGFDERYWLYGEEADLCRRVIDAGWRCQHVADATSLHIGGASGTENGDLVFDHFQRGTERFIEQRWGRRGLAMHRAGMLVGSLLRLSALSVMPGRSKTRADRKAIVKRIARVRTKRLDDRPASTRSGGDDLVVCSLEAWDDVWRRNQFLARELLRAHPRLRVLFVEPPVDRLHALSRRRLPRAPGPRRAPSDPRVTLMTPTKVLPRILNPRADKRLARRVRRAAFNAGFTQPTLWINDSVYAGLLQQTKWPSVYDITDDWLLAASTPRERRRRERREAVLMETADEVVVCSPALQRSRGATRSVSLIPNAVDTEMFRAEHPRPADLPDGKVAVYVGTLHEDRLDIGLIEAMADGLPGVDIVLVGPNALSEESNARLRRLSSVAVLGARPYAEIPAYYQHADVVIVPHVVTSFTESLDPIKRYECLASGRPTVATPVAGFADQAEPIRVATGSAFVAAVADALEAESHTATPQRLPSWQTRANAFSAVLERAAKAKADAPLRVLYLDHCAELSGGEIALLRLIDALEDVEPIVLLAEDGPLVQRLRDVGALVEIIPLPERSRGLRRARIGARLPFNGIWDTARYSVVIARRIRELRPDVVHANSLKAGVYGSLAGRLSRVPVVWHVRDRIAADYMPPVTARLVRAFIRVLPTAVVANSRTTAETLGRTHASVVHDSAPRVDRVRRETPNHLVVGLVGRIAPWKGHDLFLRTLAEVRRIHDVEGLIVGSPMFGAEAFENELRELTTELALDDCVTFTGFVDDIAGIWPSMDVLVHASIVPEPFGQVVIEGMAAGLPVIAPNTGGPAEVITDGVDGLLYEMGHSAALATAILRLVADEGLRHSLGDAALKRAEDFTPAHTAAEMTRIYRETMKQHDARVERPKSPGRFA